MVARVRAVGTVLFAAAMLGGGAGCGGESSRGGGTRRSDGTGAAGSGASGGASSMGGTGGMTLTEGEGGFVPATDAGPEAIALDGSDCGARRVASCEGISGSSYYSDHGTFDASAELAACSMWVPFDGCGELIYAFDAQGCAISVDPGPGGWQESAELSWLRDCLSAAFTTARFPCLASRSFAFYESCYIR